MAMAEDLDKLEQQYDNEVDFRKQRVLEEEIAVLTRQMEEAQSTVKADT